MKKWFHEKILRHSVEVVHVSVPAFDPSARGLLFKCSCGKTWAK